MARRSGRRSPPGLVGLTVVPGATEGGRSRRRLGTAPLVRPLRG